jgi:hypothetical protein
MKAEGLTPGQILQHSQRLMVPLFQRPYVWSKESQWEPLWDDIIRMAEALVVNFSAPPKPHFLGAVVLQHKHASINALPQRIIIDGQQRLTTLQIVIDAAQAEMEGLGFSGPAGRLRDLIENEARYRTSDDDMFKLWPTNKDRDSYREVMGAQPPIDYNTLEHRDARIVLAHRYFSEQAREFLNAGEGGPSTERADALEIALRQLLKIVVIDLDVDEDAQEIFETLNSRGVKLSSADLIKNFIFQQLEDFGADSEDAYEKYWKHFETGFWETEISSGRLKHPRTAVFLNHFLISRTGEVITAEQVFFRFKTYAENECGVGILELLKQIHAAAKVYEKHTVNAQSTNNELGGIDLFFYRTQVMEVEVVKSLVVFLLDPAYPVIPIDSVIQALTDIESWLVRRSLLRLNAKGMNRLTAQLVSNLLEGERGDAHTTIRKFLAGQTAETSYWPDDQQLREALTNLRFYNVLPTKRTRMVLEALEDHKRGIGRSTAGQGEQRCPRGNLTIEHVMPQKWETHWPLDEGEPEDVRRRTVQTLGNLTLLTSKLNSRVSNGPWLAVEDNPGKAAALHGQSSLLLNSEIGELAVDRWSSDRIQYRTDTLISRLQSIWPTPPGHRVALRSDTQQRTTYISLSDLIAARMLEPGDVLIPTWSTQSTRRATVLGDGTLELDNGEVFASLSGAARRVMNSQAAAGWGFWKLGESGPTLKELRDDYRARFNVEVGDEGDEDGVEENEPSSDE